MKRHDSLLTLTHDHHHGLSHARKLKKAASAEDDDRLAVARSFADFFRSETLTHFAEEEEQVFPLATKHLDEAGPLVARLLEEHAEMRELALLLDREIDRADVTSETLEGLGGLLERHIRVEEREFFPLLERSIPDEELRSLSYAPRDRATGER